MPEPSVCEAFRLEPIVARYALETLLAIVRPHGEDDVIGEGRWYGYGDGLAVLAGGSYGYSSHGYPYYGYSCYGYPAYRYRSAYSGAYGYSSGMGTSDSSGATAAKAAAAGPDLCGAYLFWKNDKCNDARAK